MPPLRHAADFDIDAITSFSPLPMPPLITLILFIDIAFFCRYAADVFAMLSMIFSLSFIIFRRLRAAYAAAFRDAFLLDADAYHAVVFMPPLLLLMLYLPLYAD